jgi:hypothetical protein
MKVKNIIITLGLVIAPIATYAEDRIVAEFIEVEKFTDFSINGMVEETTQDFFVSELEDESERFARKYLPEGATLYLTFTDIDMAGDIQPWRNRHDADIRYIESVYIPRMKFTYQVKDAEGNVLAEGDEKISDMSFNYNIIAPLRSRHMNFFYEINMLEDWLRKTMRPLLSKTGDK